MARRRLPGLRRSAIPPLLASASIVGLLLTGCVATPAPAPVSLAQSMEKWLGAVVSCLNDSGWAVTATDTGYGIDASAVRTDQLSAFSEDQSDCETAAGPQPGAEPMTESRASNLYAQLIESAACLRSLGYDTSEPPSESSFVDGYLRGSPVWSPYMDLPNVDPTEWARINRACPQPI